METKTTKEKLIEEADNRLAEYIPKEIDVLHEIKSDRIFCSRQAVLNLIKELINQAHEAGKEAGRNAEREEIINLIENNPTPYMFEATKERFLTDIKNHLNNE